MKTLLDLVSKANTFTLQKQAIVSSSPSLSNGLVFKVDNTDIGFVKPEAAKCFLEYSEFTTDGKSLVLDPKLDCHGRTVAIQKILCDLCQKKIFACLDGWRNEAFQIFGPSGVVLFEVERAAIGLLGVRAAGCHLNGFVRTPDGSMKMWIGKRSFNKQTYPGMLDNIVGGTLSFLQKVV